jgi:hypothetical protein
MKRNGLAVKSEFPIGWLQRGNHFGFAATGAKVRDRCKADRDIDRPFLQLLRNKLDKFVFEGDRLFHSSGVSSLMGLSSLMSLFVAVWNWL